MDLNMRSTNKRKTIVLLVLISALLVLGGWGKKKIELTASGRLIDLEKAIEWATPGTADKKANDEKQDQKTKETDKTQSDKTTQNNSETAKTFKVRIHGTRVSLNGTECKVEELNGLVKQKCTANDKVKLLDDYAEAHVYHEVDDILNNLSESIGFEYDAE